MPDRLGFWQFSLEVVLPNIRKGMVLTLQLTLLSGLFGILLGLLSSFARVSRSRIWNAISFVYVTLFRGTPLLLQIFFIFFAWPLIAQDIGAALNQPGLAEALRPEAFTAGVIALSLNAGAYITEIFRSGIQSIDNGQMEAARALGMSYNQAMRRVILPQTFRRIIPPLVNELAALSKDTSLVSAVALAEVLYHAKTLASKYLRPWEPYGWAAVGYLCIVLALMGLASILEKRLEARGS